MNLHQWGILIEIVGFVILGVLAGILFNREIIDSFPDRVNSLLSWINRTLTRVPSWRDLKPVLKYFFKSLLTLTLIAFVVIGLLYDKSWLFFIGVIWLGIGLFASVLVFIFLEKKPWLNIPLHILETAVSTIISPILVIVLVILGIGLRILRDFTGWLVKKDTVKKLLISVGTGAIIIGLTMQFIASLHLS